MMDSYADCAPVYDRFMSDCPYSARADYLLGLFREFGSCPKLMLDLACGTGSLSLEMTKRGVDVIGVDRSADMLALAREKASHMEQKALWLCQEGAELDLYGTVDSAVCTLDSMNHFADPADLASTLERLHLFLEPGGLFLFDVNSEYKHKMVLADHVYVLEDDDIFCTWQNVTEMPYTTVILDFFQRDGDRYVRHHEEFEERAWSEAELEAMLCQAGFEILARFDDMTTLPPTATTERIQYVTRRI